MSFACDRAMGAYYLNGLWEATVKGYSNNWVSQLVVE
jgi:hypothetical protein